MISRTVTVDLRRDADGDIWLSLGSCIVALPDVPSSLPGESSDAWARTEDAGLSRDGDRYSLDLGRYGIIRLDSFSGPIVRSSAIKWADEQLESTYQDT